MTTYALLYASRTCVCGPEAEAAVADIVTVSRLRNARLGVTGALVFSGGHFAQVLEGSRAVVEQLMRSIRRDPRHTDVTVIEQGMVPERRFADWSLAYAGQATFVNGIIARALAKDPEQGERNGAALRQLLEELAYA